MAHIGLGKYNSNHAKNSDRNGESNGQVLDTEGKVIPEPEIEGVMEAQKLDRTLAIATIKGLRKKAYEKQAVAKATKAQNSDPNNVPDKSSKEVKNEMVEPNAQSPNAPSPNPLPVSIIPIEETTDKLQFLQPVMTIERAVQLRQYLTAAMQKVLIRGKHYGNPINPKSGKPAWGSDHLLKPGAEVLANMFGLEARFTELYTVEDFEKNIFRYKIKCELISLKTGIVVGSAVAAASVGEKNIFGDGTDLWNNTLQRAQKRAMCKAVEHTLGVDEFFIDIKKYNP